MQSVERMCEMRLKEGRRVNKFGEMYKENSRFVNGTKYQFCEVWVVLSVDV